MPQSVFDKIKTTILVPVDDMLAVGPKEHAAGLVKEMEEHLKMKAEKPMGHEGGKTKMREGGSSGRHMDSDLAEEDNWWR